MKCMPSCFIHCPPPFNSEQVRDHFFIQSSLQNESGCILSARRNILVLLLFFVEGKSETVGRHASSFVITERKKDMSRASASIKARSSPYCTVLYSYLYCTCTRTPICTIGWIDHTSKIERVIDRKDRSIVPYGTVQY